MNIQHPTSNIQLPMGEVDGPANGSLGDVALFFRASERTVKRWMKEEPGLGHWKHGGLLVFFEEGVAEWYALYCQDAQGRNREELKGEGRRAWREFMRGRELTAKSAEIAEGVAA